MMKWNGDETELLKIRTLIIELQISLSAGLVIILSQ